MGPLSLAHTWDKMENTLIHNLRNYLTLLLPKVMDL